MLLTRYLAAAAHYFIYSQADQVHPLTLGRRYVGGHETAKGRSDEHGEKFVKVAKKTSDTSKGKGRGKSSNTGMKGSEKPASLKVTVTKVPVTQKLIDLPFLSEPPAGSTCEAKKRKKNDGFKGDG